jgi:hypothetical protein
MRKNRNMLVMIGMKMALAEQKKAINAKENTLNNFIRILK